MIRPGLRAIGTFHNNKYTAVIETVLVLSLFRVETEGPAVKRLNVIDLQRTLSLAQILWHFGTALEMVEHVTLAIMVNNAPIDFRPHATTEDDGALEAAWDQHAGAGQGRKPKRNVSLQQVDGFKGRHGSGLCTKHHKHVCFQCRDTYSQCHRPDKTDLQMVFHILGGKQ